MSLKDIDSHKLGYHPHRVGLWEATGFCFPLHIEVGITNKCNHHCVQCTLDWINHKNDSLDSDVFIKTLEDAKLIGVKSIYFAGEGEPTLHKDLPLFVKTAYDLGMKVALSTNGSYLSTLEKTLPYLSWLRFSIDAGTGKTYAKIHRVSGIEFSQVLENVSKCVKIVKENNYQVQIGIQTLLMPENINEIEKLAKTVKRIGVHNFQVKPTHCHPKSSYQIVSYQYLQEDLEKNLAELNDENFTTIVRVKSLERLDQKRTYKECHAFHFYCLIDACGNVTPCNIFYGDKELIFGNINQNSLYSIWKSSRKIKVINRITELQHFNCKEYRCRQDVMNRYLQRVKYPELNDEFI